MNTLDLIKKTFNSQIQQNINTIQHFENVPNNSVFKIETDSQSYIFKIYSSPGWPENGKVPFVYQKLSEYNIPHAQLFVFNRENNNFPNGYLIEECLTGTFRQRIYL